MAEAAFRSNPPTLPLKMLLHRFSAECEHKRIVSHKTFADMPCFALLLIWTYETEKESNPEVFHSGSGQRKQTVGVMSSARRGKISFGLVPPPCVVLLWLRAQEGGHFESAVGGEWTVG